MSIATCWSWLDALVGAVDEDFRQATAEVLPEQDRPELEFFE